MLAFLHDPALERFHIPEMMMSASIRELNQYFVDLWWACETTQPDLGPLYTDQTQTQNEKHLLHFLNQVDRILSHPPRDREEVQSQQGHLGAMFRRLAEETLGLQAAHMDILPSKAFSEVSEEFVRMARAFDPQLSAEDIYQAGRNAWTANGLQWLMGRPVQLTPSILAYSLLYPYTDNYLDDPAVTASSKLAFNERFRQRLTGESIRPANAQERIIFDLVAMIEKQYSRSEHPQVFESLLDIHRAQGRSLNLVRRGAAPGEVDVLGLSFEKGGTSVLADGYLVSGSLDEAQRQYTFGHGIFAQLLDDMEDVEPDIQAGRLTVYAQPAGHWPLDRLANRTFHFGRKVLLGLDCFDVDKSVHELIQRGADLFLVDAITRTDRYYTPDYLRALAEYSPYRFSFLKEQRDSFFRRHGPLVKWIETFLNSK